MLAFVVAPPVLVTRFERRSELTAIVRAALDVDIVYVPLAEAPPYGRHTLELWVGQDLVASVTAELVGSGRGGEYPLRVRPLVEADVPALELLVDRSTGHVGGPLPARAAFPPDEAATERRAIPATPPPASKSTPSMAAVTEAAIEDSTLASRGVPPARPTSMPPPPRNTPTPMPTTDEEAAAATTLFDPEGLLRTSQAPQTGSSSDDSLTIPRTSNAPVSRRRLDPDMPVTDDSNTLPHDGSAPTPTVDVSWNIRITPTTKDPLCGRVIANGKYVLDSVIGSGAIGIVFKASHRDLARTVAIKVLNPRYRDNADLMATFRSEARAASQLEHANVARVYDYGQEEDGLVYIVMEYLSGYTLGSVLAARRRLTEARAVDVMMQVCAALSAAHERGIVHRDVKPDNIVLVPAQDDEGQPVEIVKVCDFGIAALGKPQTPEGFAAGSPEYMAPEQSTGTPVTAAADVYSCGILLYQMLLGHVPFTDPQPYRILMKHQNEPPEPPSKTVPTISPGLEAIILRALEKQPARRFQNARELRAELRRVAEQSS